mmetsp:Transcript_86910/g.251058  ORF Transcript_86910/g.251058 Transcript_86910/m.251058 type:complete len:319 (-) Transcript_86910:1398-2354(-)
MQIRCSDPPVQLRHRVSRFPGGLAPDMRDEDVRRPIIRLNLGVRCIHHSGLRPYDESVGLVHVPQPTPRWLADDLDRAVRVDVLALLPHFRLLDDLGEKGDELVNRHAAVDVRRRPLQQQHPAMANLNASDLQLAHRPVAVIVQRLPRDGLQVLHMVGATGVGGRRFVRKIRRRKLEMHRLAQSLPLLELIFAVVADRHVEVARRGAPSSAVPSSAEAVRPQHRCPLAVLKADREGRGVHNPIPAASHTAGVLILLQARPDEGAGPSLHLTARVRRGIRGRVGPHTAPIDDEQGNDGGDKATTHNADADLQRRTDGQP